jgi:hypothetical protein
MTRGDTRQKIMLLAKNNDVHAPAVLASMRCQTYSRRHSHTFGLSGRTKNFAHWSLCGLTHSIENIKSYHFCQIFFSVSLCVIDREQEPIYRTHDRRISVRYSIKRALSTKDELPRWPRPFLSTMRRRIFDHAYA